MQNVALEARLEDIFRLTEVQKRALKKLSLAFVRDLLHYAPARYISTSSLKSISSLASGEQVALEGQVKSLKAKKTWQKRLRITEAKIADASGEITAVWFHQPYISKMLTVGDFVRLEGKITDRKGKLFISNPLYEKIAQLSYHAKGAASLIAIYSTTRNLSSRWFQYRIAQIFEALDPTSLPDPVPDDILSRYHLPALGRALVALHFPKNEKEVMAAKKRLAFDEIFFIQLSRMDARLKLEEQSSLVIPYDKQDLAAFTKLLPFSLTKTQLGVLDALLKDISKKTPMARLLEGDVGSGKTVLAAAISNQVTKAGFQTTYMAPTEILARQHFDNFCKLLGGTYTKIGLLASSEARVFPSKAYQGQSAHISKSQLFRWTLEGEIKILIGTHALLNEKIQFRNLAFIVVDEQHRFGVSQRKRLAGTKSRDHSFVPHFLSMTATPIPRTLALTVFGDLDLSVLDELPPGRMPIHTEVLIKPKTRSWDHIQKELEKGRQAFIICPRIDEGESEQKSVKKEYERISKEIFPQFKSAMLHGKMKPLEKEKTLEEFRKGTIHILIATSVVEVGIDIPNATIMIVEGADRFGLAQLHQLRGRIGRGTHQSYFYAVSDSASGTTVKRLRSLERAKNGFELAEYDLELRGPGELTGKNQWGLSDLAMEALKNIKMVEAARTEARALLEKDRTLSDYPQLKGVVEKLTNGLYHFE